MSAGEAVEHLKRLQKLGERVVGVNELVKVYPFDGAVAFMKAMQRKFGWAQPVPTPGFFGDRAPATVSIESGPNETATIFWGRFEIPGVDGYVECGFSRTDDNEPVFEIGGEVKQAHLAVVAELAQLTRQIARDESIYRGKALRLRINEDGDINVNAAPGFIDLRNRTELILPDLVDASVRANLLTPIERTDACRRAGIPVKRGVILSGPPGTGKTLAAFEVAHKCIENGWTFILVPKCKSLADAMLFATRYAPAVVFAEDIDQITSGDRNEAFNHLLNTVDGVNTKNQDVMLVFTTNHLGNIERTMVRPGRIDAIIEFPPPDHATIERFLRYYGGSLIEPDMSLMRSCDALEGAIPAIVREAVERAKLYALSRGADPDHIRLTDDDILVAVKTMEAHTVLPQQAGEGRDAGGTGRDRSQGAADRRYGSHGRNQVRHQTDRRPGSGVIAYTLHRPYRDYTIRALFPFLS
ncbi:ATP-dependent 26S proteasome regulatory subunit [Opitutaceae bacterium TAV1]|nr:ATP-dependent 26S proteasome regulatory subunit [Opitutaceae bacterium TAV1]